MSLRITVLGGAGMSAESGIPTFRDALTGLWARFDPEQLATPAAFDADPSLVWGWYRWRAAAVRRASPNAGHTGIVRLQRLGHAVTVVTQNVDDLHERAGSTDVIHLHGSLFASRCRRCGHRLAPDPIDPELFPPAFDAAGGGTAEMPPQCPKCTGLARPGVVWFGEALPEPALRKAEAAIARSDLLLVVGTSGLVYPAAALPLSAKSLGVCVLEINPDATALSGKADACWRTTASEGMRRLAALLESAPGARPRDVLAI